MTLSSHSEQRLHHCSRSLVLVRLFLSAINGCIPIPSTILPGRRSEKCIKWVSRSGTTVGPIPLSPYPEMLPGYPPSWRWLNVSCARLGFLNQSALPGVGMFLDQRRYSNWPSLVTSSHVVVCSPRYLTAR